MLCPKNMYGLSNKRQNRFFERGHQEHLHGLRGGASEARFSPPGPAAAAGHAFQPRHHSVPAPAYGKQINRDPQLGNHARCFIINASSFCLSGVSFFGTTAVRVFRSHVDS